MNGTSEYILCPWEDALYLVYSSNVPDLIYYSHVTAMFFALLLSVLVLLNNPKDIVARLFLLFSTLFSVWAFLDILLWATNDPASVMFSWSMQILLEPLVFCIGFYMFYLYLYQKAPSFLINLGVAAVLLPVIIFLPTEVNLQGLWLSSCESIEGPLAKYYSYFANSIFLISIVTIGCLKIPKLGDGTRKKVAVYFGIGLCTFLLSYTSGNIISSFTDDWTISQYGLFGMPVFAAILGYSIVRFNAFNIQLAAVHALTLVLWALVGSLLLVVEATHARIVSVVTLVFITITGFLLAQSVSREIRQRKELEKLTKQLEKANKRLKELDKLKSEFVSIASHQLRSPLTSIRGYASMLAEGSFGKLPAKGVEPVERIAESARLMAVAVEDYLNVSRIESGNMKYNLSDFNIKDEVEKITDDIRPNAIKKGLMLMFRTKLNSAGIVNADIGKSVQIIHNLINNSLKYTPKGSITVIMRDDVKKKKIFIDVTDTGIGMSQETIDKVFEKFERADNANSVNVAGTGLGLFVALKMAHAMNGDITATSEGDGKGSTFTFELPLVQ